eukprot:333286-Rhodomonas_salina.1
MGAEQGEERGGATGASCRERHASESKASRASACINGGGGQASVVGMGAGGGASSCCNLKGAASGA